METIKKENPWMIHLKGVKEKNPNLKLSEVMQLAKQTYKKLSIPEYYQSIPEYTEDETQNLKQASLENNPVKSEQVNKPETTLVKQEDLQLNNIPPAIISNKIPITTPEEKIEKHLNNFGRTITTLEEKEKFEKVKSQLPFWKVFAFILLICFSLVFAGFFYYINQGKFQSTYSDNSICNATSYSEAPICQPCQSCGDCSPILNATCVPQIKVYINST